MFDSNAILSGEDQTFDSGVSNSEMRVLKETNIRLKKKILELVQVMQKMQDTPS